VTPPTVSNVRKFAKLRRRLADMAGSANTASRDFAALLRDFGFCLRPPGGTGHVVVTHPAFMLGPDDEANYNGEHGEGNAIKRPYIKKFLKLVDGNKEALEGYLK
jgi:hypothetical protein